jgi:hypothetical protein
MLTVNPEIALSATNYHPHIFLLHYAKGIVCAQDIPEVLRSGKIAETDDLIRLLPPGILQHCLECSRIRMDITHNRYAFYRKI